MARDINSITSSAAAALRNLLLEAFEAGRAAGRQEASSDLRAKLSQVIGPIETQPQPPPSTGARATPGTVKPTIRNLVTRSGLIGISADEIVAQTGIKRNSVRGTLYTLKQDGEVERRGERWFPQKAEAADTPSQDSLRPQSDSASPADNPSAKGREAGHPGGGT